MSNDDDLLKDASLTLEELCAAAALEREWLVQRVEEGLIPVTGAAHTEWRFTSVHLARARRMNEIERTYDAVPELSALVADLLEEMDALRARLRRAGLA
jgi:chaperone modulatory protein CbpM